MSAAVICRDCVVHSSVGDPPADCPAVLFGELVEEIESALAAQPRSQQKQIGPSEIGNPCTRALIHKLAGDEEPERTAGPDGWRAWVGTQMHAGLDRIMTASPLNRGALGQRYFTERKVAVGLVNGIEIVGSCDLFDALSGTVIDYKSKSKTQLEKARRDITMGRGPGPEYRTQAHLYGRGWQGLGRPVKRVMIWYLPRDGNLRDGFYWSERYSEQIAIDALARCTGLAQLIDALGVQGALDMYPTTCDEPYCGWCGPSREGRALVDLEQRRRDNSSPAKSVRELIAR